MKNFIFMLCILLTSSFAFAGPVNDKTHTTVNDPIYVKITDGTYSQSIYNFDNTWAYAAASGGITNTTTAVTIKAAAGSGLRNYLTSCQISHDTLGAATDLVFRDGDSGTILNRQRLRSNADDDHFIILQAPIRTTANTLLEVATLTAVSGAIYINCQGFISQ